MRPNPEYTGRSNQLPYLYHGGRPFMETSITSNMRLFTPSDMTIGEYGTAVWIDAQSDLNTTSQAGDLGQRLAGQILESRTNHSAYGSQEDSRAGLRGVLMLTSETERKALPQYGSVAQPTFGIWGTFSEWAKVAVEEKEGRIALGSVEGRVHIMDYA